VYRKAEQEKDGTWLKPRYAACTYDACELICKAHENLKHARVRMTYNRLHESYYGITEAQVEWVL
jgi:hypothetical protein